MNIEVRWSDLVELFNKSTKIFIKKLSRNDCAWADGAENGHQNGIYIPKELQGVGFFPELLNLNIGKPHIFEAFSKTFWPSIGVLNESRFVHYSNKGSEMHFTRVPKIEFSGLNPASFCVGGIFKVVENDVRYWFVTIDSVSEEAELLETVFNINSDFHCALYDSSEMFNSQKSDADELISELNSALRDGTLADFISSVCKLPTSEKFASLAQAEYLKEHGLPSLNPFVMDSPGDAVMKISRDIEFRLYKREELKHRAAEVLRIITKDASDIVTAIVKGYPELNATFLSASQHRKSRAGRSFEHHIARLLKDGSVPYQEQVISGTRRPDFVLPSYVKLLEAENGNPEEALILSAKTTLRERWKQVVLEKNKCDFFLITVDDRVSLEALTEMEDNKIFLVVPESLKSSKDTYYKSKNNVITFKELFESNIKNKMQQFWVAHSLVD